MNRIAELVEREGCDGAAEERIVYILAMEAMKRVAIAYINTDEWRKKIRKAQGRKRVRRV